MALFTYAFVRSPRTLRIFMLVLMLVFFKLGSEAFIGKVTGSMIWENQGIMRLNGPLGSRFGHPNSLSGLAVCTLPFLYYLFPVASRKWKMGSARPARVRGQHHHLHRIAHGLHRDHRAGRLPLDARRERRGASSRRWRSCAVVGLPFLPEQYEGRFKSAFVGQEIEGHSKAGRLEIAGDAWHLFLANPQGLGIYCLPVRAR